MCGTCLKAMNSYALSMLRLITQPKAISVHAERGEKMARLIDADKCPVCGGVRVNESDEPLDICRQEWNYCPVCGRFIGDEVEDETD